MSDAAYLSQSVTMFCANALVLKTNCRMQRHAGHLGVAISKAPQNFRIMGAIEIVMPGTVIASSLFHPDSRSIDHGGGKHRGVIGPETQHTHSLETRGWAGEFPSMSTMRSIWQSQAKQVNT
jgi:hypothetical protein